MEVVKELFADRFSVEAIRHALLDILPGTIARRTMEEGYEEVHRRLGNICAPDNAARLMVKQMRGV